MVRFELHCPGHHAVSQISGGGYKYCSGCTMRKSFVKTVSKSEKTIHRRRPKLIESSGYFYK